MNWTIYIIILAYFLLGFIGFYFINRRKPPAESRNSWIKYFTYLIIIHVLFFSIVFLPTFFRILAIVIIAGSFYELFKVYRQKGYVMKPVYYTAVVVLALFAAGFYAFSGLATGLILFTFLILSIFDSFSQVIGQIWGRRKLFRKISPQKTVEGFIGGIVIAVGSAYWLDGLLAGTGYLPMRLATGIVAFAFLGDMITSLYKRKYDVKDFSTFIPGHGGFLDRFDSLIAGGAFISLYILLMNE